MLTTRQESILKLIVEGHVRTAAPIGSATIAKAHDLGVSPATIRKDVAALEVAGYIKRPHASSGSLPLDKAYRHYVESVVSAQVDQVPKGFGSAMRRELSGVERDVEEWASAAAGILARRVGNMAIATFPKAKESRVKHLEIVYLQDFLALLIVVLEQARLRRQLIRLDQPIEQEELNAPSNRVRSELTGLTRREIESKAMMLTPLEADVVEATVLILREEDEAAYRDHYVDGMRNLLNQPEFAENDKVRAMVQSVEDGSLVRAVLDETPGEGAVRVIIGEENKGNLLWPLSVVICRYGIPGEAIGAVGAVGPTRMEYSKTIASVRLLSSVMSDLVEAVHTR